LPRVLAICCDPAFCQELVKALQSQIDFVVSLGNQDSIDAESSWREFHPDLFVLEAPVSPDVLKMVAALKSVSPETPLFLITDRPNMQSEKEALAHGVDAVFAKTSNFSSLIMNARAVCGCH